MIDAKTRIRPNPRVEHRTLTGGEAVLLHLDTAAYHGLNATADLIWEAVGGGSTFGDLVTAIRERLADAPQALEDDIAAFVAALAERDLLLLEADGTAKGRSG